MLEHLDDVVDDLSVFHEGVTYDNALELPSSRFFRMASRLHLRDGAVRQTVALRRGDEVVAQQAAPPPPPAAEPADVDVDNSGKIAAIAAMSQVPGFPSIGYAR